MKKKQLLAALLAASVLTGLTACGSPAPASSAGSGAASQTASSGTPMEKITLVLDWTPNTNHTGLYVAQNLGYFKEEGLEVTIEQPPEDGAVALVGAGKAQFGVAFQDTDMAPTLSSETPLPVTAVAALIQHNTSGIFSLKEKNITRPKDMEGHSYATWNTPVEQAMVNHVIQKDGGDPAKLTMVPTGNSFDAVAAIRTSVDTAWVYAAWDGMSAKVQGVETNYFAFKDIDPVLDYYTPVLVANNTFLTEQPETAKKFLSAVQKGYQYAIVNPEKAADILMEEAPELKANRELIVQSQIWLAGKYQDGEAQWGSIDVARWDAFFQWLYENKLIEKEIPSGNGFTNEFLPK